MKTATMTATVLVAFLCNALLAEGGKAGPLQELLGKSAIRKVDLKLTPNWNFGKKVPIEGEVVEQDFAQLIRIFDGLEILADKERRDVDSIRFPAVIEVTIHAEGRKPLKVEVPWQPQTKAELRVIINDKTYIRRARGDEEPESDPVIDLHKTLQLIFKPGNKTT